MLNFGHKLYQGFLIPSWKSYLQSSNLLFDILKCHFTYIQLFCKFYQHRLFQLSEYSRKSILSWEIMFALELDNFFDGAILCFFNYHLCFLSPASSLGPSFVDLSLF